jgi:hypothetical protein
MLDAGLSLQRRCKFLSLTAYANSTGFGSMVQSDLISSACIGLAREIATLRRLREKRNARLRGTSSPCCRFRRIGFTATLANYGSHGEWGRKPYAFPTEASRRGFGEMSASSFAKMVSRMRSRFHRQHRVCPLFPAPAPCKNKVSYFVQRRRHG